MMLLMMMMMMIMMIMMLWRRRLAFGGLRLAAVDGIVDASRFGSGAGVGGGLRRVGWRGAAAGGSVVRDAVTASWWSTARGGRRLRRRVAVW